MIIDLNVHTLNCYITGTDPQPGYIRMDCCHITPVGAAGKAATILYMFFGDVPSYLGIGRRWG